MNLGALILSFLEALLTCAVIVLVAFAFRWGIREFTGKPLDADVEKWGRFVVGLLCVIVLVAWLLSIFGYIAYPFPTFRPVVIR